MKEIIENKRRTVSVYSPLHYSDVQKTDFNQKNQNLNKILSE